MNGELVHHLNDDEMFDHIITILYSRYEVVSDISMTAIKYLHDHPKALQQLRVSTAIFHAFIALRCLL